ncbi:hypothetical protein AT251_24520 [Enterovibrio nigricans]|nr:hypothetical protein [Enterovibrio nigricans]PKF48650.1 hypothetical protein AT251_24520 [Enterovibrio nigricans]
MPRTAYGFCKKQTQLDVMPLAEDEKNASQNDRRYLRRWDVFIMLLIVFDACLIVWDWVYLAH